MVDSGSTVVTRREITAETVRVVTRLTVLPEQRGFVATNAESLAQALFNEEAWYRAIYAGDTPAGFVMLAKPGAFAIVPRGTWHTARTSVPTKMLCVTPGEGTDHRPA